MLRTVFLLFALTAGTAFNGGCRSCSDCHDYDAPVANCDCNACGTHRSGSVSSGYSQGSYYEEGGSVEQPANGQPTEETGVEL